MRKQGWNKNKCSNILLGGCAILGMLGGFSDAMAVEYTEGPAVAVDYFKGSGPDAHMGRGLASSVATDMVGAIPPECKMIMIEWQRRADIEKEQALQKSRHVDPKSRVGDKRIDPRYFVEGNVDTTATELSWSLQVRDSKTGQIVTRDSGTVKTENWTEASEGISKRIVNKFCRKGREYSSEPSRAKSVTDILPNPVKEIKNMFDSIKGIWGR